jgi:hypothetical protein
MRHFVHVHVYVVICLLYEVNNYAFNTRKKKYIFYIYMTKSMGTRTEELRVHKQGSEKRSEGIGLWA